MNKVKYFTLNERSEFTLNYTDFTINNTNAMPISMPTFGFGVRIKKSSVILYCVDLFTFKHFIYRIKQ